jgi:hypothetical protein
MTNSRTYEPLDLPQAWGQHLSSFRWTHVATLTHSRLMPPPRLTWLFARFVRHLEQIAQGPVPWFCAVEAGSQSAHLHALLAGTSHLGVRQIAARWTHGYTRVAQYDASRGAAYYVAKAIASAPDSYDVSRRSPPRAMVCTA